MRIEGREPYTSNVHDQVARLVKDNDEYVTTLFRRREVYGGGWDMAIKDAGYPSTVKVDLDHYSMKWLREML